MHEAKVIIQAGDCKETMLIYRSLIPDTKTNDSRSSVKIKRHRDSLIIRVSSEDIAGLRAALSTMLRGCDVAIESLKVAKGCEKK